MPTRDPPAARAGGARTARPALRLRLRGQPWTPASASCQRLRPLRLSVWLRGTPMFPLQRLPMQRVLCLAWGFQRGGGAARLRTRLPGTRLPLLAFTSLAARPRPAPLSTLCRWHACGRLDGTSCHRCHRGGWVCFNSRLLFALPFLGLRAFDCCVWRLQCCPFPLALFALPPCTLPDRLGEAAGTCLLLLRSCLAACMPCNPCAHGVVGHVRSCLPSDPWSSGGPWRLVC